MYWTILFVTSLIAALIFLQDLKDRAVTWFYFPVLAFMGIAAGFAEKTPLPAMAFHTLANLGFLLLQFALLTIYFRLRKGKLKIGWGDVLFLAATCFYFSPANFLLFYCLSLVFALVLHLSFAKKNATVPLAGLQSMFLVLFLVACKLTDHSTGNDDWIMNYL